MKKIKIKILVVIILLLSLLSCGSYIAVHAEGEEQSNVIQITDAAEYFDEKIMPLIVIGGTVIASILTFSPFIIRAIKKLKNLIDSAIFAMEQAKTHVTERDAQISKRNSLIDSKVERIAQLNSDVLSLKNEISSLRNGIAEINKMCKIAFLNDPYLVSNGYAKQIAEVAENEVENETEIIAD